MEQMEEEESRKRTAETQDETPDYSRGYPETDDLAVFKKDSGSYKLCILDKTTDTRKTPEYANGKLLSGRAFDVDLIPDEEFAHKVAEKLLVIDRPLCVGDLVTLFRNAHVGTEKEREMWNVESNDLGIVIGRRIEADLSLYPDHKCIIRGVQLERDGVTSLFEKDLVLFDTWIGRAKNYVYNVNIIYKDRYRATVKVSHGKDGLVLRRPYSYQTTFPFVQGEIVIIPKNNQFVQWKGIAPRFLRRGRSRAHRSISDTVPAKIESSESYEVEVDWFYSGGLGGSRKPPRIFRGADVHGLIDLVPEANFLNCALNSVTIVPKATDTIVSMAEYKQEMAREFEGKFELFTDSPTYGDESDDEEMSPKRARLEQDEQDESLPGPSTDAYSDEWEVAPISYGTPTRSRRSLKKIVGKTVTAKIARTRTLLSVKWPDGTIEHDVPSHQLVAQNPDIDQEDHVINSIVIKKTFTGDSSHFYGLIRKVDESDRSCLVRWFSRVGTDFDNLGDEECTLFDIMKHPKYTSDFIGSFGIDPARGPGPLKDYMFNFVENLDNGKMKVRYLDGRTKEINMDEMIVVPLEDDQVAEEDDQEQELTYLFIWDKIVRGVRSYLETKDISFPEEDTAVFSYIKYKLGHICNLIDETSFKRRVSEMGNAYVHVGREMDRIIDDIRETGNLKCVAHVVNEINKHKTAISFPENFIYFLYNSQLDGHMAATLSNISGVSLLVDMGNIFYRDDNRKVLMAKMKTEDLERAILENSFNWGYGEGDGLVDLNTKQMFLFFLVYRFLTAGEYPPNLLRFYETNLPPPITVDDVREVPKSFGYIGDREYDNEETPHFKLVQMICQLAGCPVDGFYYLDMRLSSIFATAAKVLYEALQWGRQRLVTGPPISYRELIVNVELLPVVQTYPFQELLKVTDPDQIRVQGNVTITKALGLFLSADMARIWHRFSVLHDQGYSAEQVYLAINNIGQTTGKIRTVRVEDIDAYAQPCQDKSDHNCARKEILRWRDRLAKATPPNNPPVEMVDETNESNVFSTLPECPLQHCYYKAEKVIPNRQMLKAIRYDFGLFKELPGGIFVKAYEDRTDLLSALIVGPDGTPYEGVPFMFDIQLPNTYPSVPPKMAYIPWCKEQLNPNLYQTGRVCVSLLGTWDGKGTENWVAFQSSLLQVFISIQSMILVAEPFYNEAGYEARRHEPDTITRSQRYSEGAAVNAFEYMFEIYNKPHPAFGSLIRELIEKKWLSGYGETVRSWAEGRDVPGYPNLGPSKGFQMAVQSWHTKMDEMIGSQAKVVEMEEQVEEEAVEEEANERYNGTVQWILIPENEKCFAGIDLPLIEHNFPE